MKATAKAPSTSGYLPTLDGWRAIAVFMVIVHHDRLLHVGRISSQWFHAYGGDHGVGLFFALSGLLIGSRLLQEEKIRGRIDLRGFYIRRVCRIQPAAWVYLAFCSVLILTGVMNRSWSEILACFLLVKNYLPLAPSVHSWYTGHFWSLSVEEHFYFFLPLFLVLVRRYRAAILGCMVVAVEIWRLHALSTWDPSGQHGIPGFHTDAAVGGILLAVVAALLLMRPAVSDWCVRWLHPVPVLLLAVAILWRMQRHYGRFGHVSFIALYVLLIVSTMYHPRSWAGRLLETPPLRFLGRISYSLYLWQMIFFDGLFWIAPLKWPALVYVQSTPLRYLALLVMALLSYHVIERPMMRVGHRLAKPATAGREELEPETPTTPTLPADGAQVALVMEGHIHRPAEPDVPALRVGLE